MPNRLRPNTTIRVFWTCFVIVIAVLVVYNGYRYFFANAISASVAQREAIRKIGEGHPEDALRNMGRILDKDAKDGEAHFVLAAAASRLGREDVAVEHMRRSIDQGVPKVRFVAEAEGLFANIRNTDAFAELMSQTAGRPLLGPMLGSVTDHSAQFWLLTCEPGELQVRASRHKDFSDPIASSIVRTISTDVHASIVRVEGLQPDTQYYYEVLIDGNPVRAANDVGHCRTAPSKGQDSMWRIAFGGGAGYQPDHERMWTTIAATIPDALLLLGDNVYSDAPESEVVQRYCYRRRQARPEFRKLVANVPVYAIWDDHDFATDNCCGGANPDHPAWKRRVWETFRQNWVNPGFGAAPDHPGCWFKFTYGNVDVFLLDGRYYRTGTEAAATARSMLGPVQLAWLLDALRDSQATFKLICSPVPWALGASSDVSDAWDGYADERELIFQHLSKHKIEGVILVSADRHRSDLWKIDRPDGYPLYELCSSRLTNDHSHPEASDAVFSYNRTPSFGLLDVDTIRDEPTATYRIMTIDGVEVFRYVIPLSQLR